MRDTTQMSGKGLKQEKSPKNAVSCQKCPTRVTCKEICPEIEAILPRPQGGCKNKIKHYIPEVLEDMANRRALKYKGLMGRKIPPIEEYD